MTYLIIAYLLIVFAVPVAVSTIVRYRALPLGRQCPACRGETIWLSPHWRWRSLRPPVQRRWCIDCGWQGMTRPREQPTHAASLTLTPTTQTLDVRSLTVNGRAWRVMLQCWHRTGLFYGRLVFIAPSGRLWLDDVESFAGTTHHEVLGQALSLPDGLLTNRLQKLVDDY